MLNFPHQGWLGPRGTVSSMGVVGHCADNAACESFFGLLKRERVNHRRYRTRDEVRALDQLLTRIPPDENQPIDSNQLILFD